MVREIHLTEVLKLKEKDWLGKFSSDDDFDELIDEDTDVYLPDGTLVLVYRKKALKTWWTSHRSDTSTGGGLPHIAPRSTVVTQLVLTLINSTGARFTRGQVSFFPVQRKASSTTLVWKTAWLSSTLTRSGTFGTTHPSGLRKTGWLTWTGWRYWKRHTKQTRPKPT